MEKIDLLWKRSESGGRIMLWSGFALIVCMAVGMAMLNSGRVFFAEEMQSLELVVMDKAASVAVYPARTRGELLMQKIAVRSLEANREQLRMFFRALTVLILKFLLIQGVVLICLSIARGVELKRIKAGVAEALALGKG